MKKIINKNKKRLDLFNKRVYRRRVTENTAKDRLEILKLNYEKEIQAKENELAVLQAKLASLIEFAAESERVQNPKAKQNKYADMGATEAILDAVSFLWRKGKGVKLGVQSYRIKNQLLANGFKRTTQFSVVVSVTLGRLVGDGRLCKVVDNDGNYFYKPNEQISGNGSGR
jgi:hypothetical protein